MKNVMTAGTYAGGPDLNQIAEEIRKQKELSALGGADPKVMKLMAEQKRINDAVSGGGMELSLSDNKESAPSSSASGMSKGVRMAEAGSKLLGLGDGSNGSASGGIMSGGLSGASMGAQTGNPYAIAGGAALGGILGGLKAKSARKKAQAEAQAQMHEKLGGIEAEKALRLQNAMQAMAAGMGAALRG